MVRLQTKKIKKKYKQEKGKYCYPQHLLPFPRRENKALQPFLKKDLQFRMNVKDDTLNVSLKKPKDEGETS